MRVTPEAWNQMIEEAVGNKPMRELVDELIYMYDRARMNGTSSASLAEHRMYKIFELEKEIEKLKTEEEKHRSMCKGCYSL